MLSIPNDSESTVVVKLCKILCLNAEAETVKRRSPTSWSGFLLAPQACRLCRRLSSASGIGATRKTTSITNGYDADGPRREQLRIPRAVKAALGIVVSTSHRHQHFPYAMLGCGLGHAPCVNRLISV